MHFLIDLLFGLLFLEKVNLILRFSENQKSFHMYQLKIKINLCKYEHDFIIISKYNSLEYCVLNFIIALCIDMTLSGHSISPYLCAPT